MILGTSDEMVDKIAKNLGFEPVSERIYITDVATEQEMATARNIRVNEGKHVIPVPTFAIKKDFSGYLLDPLQIFKSKGKGKAPYVSEKSIIRPTFSYYGNFKISDTVFKQIIDVVISKTEGVHKAHRVIISRHQGFDDGLYINLEVIINYGYNINETMLELKKKIIKEIDKLTAMNVLNMNIVVKGVNVENKT